VEHNKASENCFVAAIASSDVVLMWFWVVATVLCRRMRWITESSTPRPIQIRSQATPESMPLVPEKSSTLQHVFHLSLIAGIKVERMSDRVGEDQLS
jgi:hypothetical protein